MFNENDLKVLQNRGITEQQLLSQLKCFSDGFPYLRIEASTSIGKGIVKIDADREKQLLAIWDSYLQTDAEIIKFVPASGAASRMFKDLFEFLEKDANASLTDFEQAFFTNIKRFAFYNQLNECCKKSSALSVEELINQGKHKTVVEHLLLETGLNYGALPKGLLQFHTYTHETRTPTQEHLAEGALYASNKSSKVKIHFTVSKEHRQLFEAHVYNVTDSLSEYYGKAFSISFSEQKPSTDTIAADSNNEPFRESDGKMVFRPGGHGALIENLNDLDADVIFIKNIDNVVPDSLKDETVKFKKIIAGLLLDIQNKCFEYLHLLDKDNTDEAKLSEMLRFLENELFVTNKAVSGFSKQELKNYIKLKLNRPIRICGMVKNVGEPGGGPFLTENSDGSVSPQILESSQINTNIPSEKAKMLNSTHFNPVDLVCAVKDYKGSKFNLANYVDKNTGFISSKSKNGKELKALELPGLWNGAMSDWNTVFVEVPIITFNPVKTVNDLLRNEHQ